MKRAEWTIVLAPDSFKESMTAQEACAAMERGIRKASPDITCIHAPMADGGEGTMQALVDGTGGTVYSAAVTGPLGSEVTASYGITGDGRTGVLEMASASGLELVPPGRRNPLLTTTYGTGQLIRACLDHGVDRLVIGIGGSATNDGGAGMVQALGGRLLDDCGKEIGYGGGALAGLHVIDLAGLDPRLKQARVDVACDVSNPLCGENGASRVFGPQKGASPEAVMLLDDGLRHYAAVIKAQLGRDIAGVPGSGAAGGLGAGLMAFLDGRLNSGAGLVMEHTRLEEKIKLADMVWTGEGGIDVQTRYGKTPLGVAEAAKRHGKPVVAFAGGIGQGAEELYSLGIDAMFSIVPGAIALEEALRMGPVFLERAAENAARLLLLTRPLD